MPNAHVTDIFTHSLPQVEKHLKSSYKSLLVLALAISPNKSRDHMSGIVL